MKQTISVLLLSFCWFLPASAQIDWMPYENNPVIGPEFDIESQAIYRPSVVKWQGKYHMWYGKFWLQTRWVAYATSEDGIEWELADNAVLGPSSTQGTFDEIEATYGSVILDGDTLKMWFAGRGNQENGIGFAWSVDGSTWTKVPGPDAGNSVLDPVSDGAGAVVITLPTVVKHDGTYHMWYSRITPINTTLGFVSNLGYARSSNGLSWHVISGAGSNGSVLDNGQAPAFDSIALLYATALHNGESFEMWYQGVGSDPFLQYISRVGCAESSDGISWDKRPGSQADAGACFNSLAQPFVLLEENVYKMWYALSAVDPNNDIVQYATSEKTETAVEGEEVPAQINLLQIYPNPTTSQATVRFSVASQARLLLKIYDMLGREVSRTDLGMLAPGNQTVRWVTTDTPSGVYILSLTSSANGHILASGIVNVAH